MNRDAGSKTGAHAARGGGSWSLDRLSRSQQVAGLATLAAMLLAVVLDNTPAETWYGVVHPSAAALVSASSLGIALGLFVGKPLGIFGATWLAVRLGLAKLPQAVGWRQLFGVALVAGIGFTMSLFIAGLAFADRESFRNARLGVIAGSLLSAAAGVAVLWSAGSRQRSAASNQAEPFP